MDGITESMDMNLGKLREMVKEREAWQSPWGRKESNPTWQPYNSNNKIISSTVKEQKKQQTTQ